MLSTRLSGHHVGSPVGHPLSMLRGPKRVPYGIFNPIYLNYCKMLCTYAQYIIHLGVCKKDEVNLKLILFLLYAIFSLFFSAIKHLCLIYL